MNKKLLGILFFIIMSFVPSNSFAEDQITIQTDKETYAPGDLIDLTGTIRGASNQLVAIEAKDSGGTSILIRTVQTDSSGNFELKFKIPTSAKPGSVDIVANSQMTGVTLTASKTISQGPTQTTPFGGRCLIATAAFGSEAAPQVQFLRGIRDNNILSTESGSGFIAAFNDVYYSFSPYVADSERQNPYLRDTIRTSIYPLLGILQISQISQIEKSEASVIGTGMLVSSLLGATYLWPAGLAVKSVRKGMIPNLKITLGMIAISLIAVVSSLVSSNATGLMISTSVLVLSVAAASALFMALFIVKLVHKFKTIRTIQN